MHPRFDLPAHGLPLPAIRQITIGQPLVWLQKGWADVRANPLPSLAYGLLFALGGDLIILALLNQPHLLSVAISGFFLVAPLLAAGLYELSRSRAQGEKLLFIESLRCFRRHGQSLLFFGGLLGLTLLFWERVSALAFGLLALDTSAQAGAYLVDLLRGGEHWPITLLWLATGGLLAMLIFMLSVVAVPMLLAEDTELSTAMLASLRACAHNAGPLLLWALLIVGLTLFGFATLLFGLVLIMPILGHASWHAYRDLVE